MLKQRVIHHKGLTGWSKLLMGEAFIMSGLLNRREVAKLTTTSQNSGDRLKCLRVRDDFKS
jgi:hypothetical protein